MVHRMHTNYIIEVIADGWDRPGSFGSQDSVDQSGTYRVVDNSTAGDAASYGYATAHVFPSWVTDICPSAPNCTHGEAHALVSSQGASGAAWYNSSQIL